MLRACRSRRPAADAGAVGGPETDPSPENHPPSARADAGGIRGTLSNSTRDAARLGAGNEAAGSCGPCLSPGHCRRCRKPCSARFRQPHIRVDPCGRSRSGACQPRPGAAFSCVGGWRFARPPYATLAESGPVLTYAPPANRFQCSQQHVTFPKKVAIYAHLLA